ncbi:unnamed protein product [Adineta steineri]|uniref:C-type lectin domain-containing protein n=1 Tax=Adineta steineri TaxID=433720 RepID=A0A815G3F0_9BILA|nr:unnamed protein product [Adineta steineri]CAF1590384.1 unnamed protein product [Adineta steineri]
MLRSHFEFACVLYIIFIFSVLSVSFNDFCSNDLSCHYPLICSNLSKCICPSSSSFWNTKQNSCLSCPSGWIEWQHGKCLLFIMPSKNDSTYEKARNSCLTYSSELIHIDNDEDFNKLQYKVDDIDWKFLSDGVWISREETNLFEWCDAGYEHNHLLWNSCIRLMKKYPDKNNVTSFCLRYTQCNENLPYICEKLAETLEVNNTINNFATIERAWSALIGPIINLAGTLFGSSQQPAPEPQQPEIQVISVSPNPQAQRPSLLASFNESCSNNFSCINPLICSNTNKCLCPESSLFWNYEENDCFYCLPGWILWENNHCVSFAVPSENGLSYNQANDICQSFSAQLYRIHNIDEFKRFELQVNALLNSSFSSAVTLFFRLGAWIDSYDIKELEDVWCNENKDNSTFDCVAIRKENSKNGSLCLSRLKCHEEMLFICDMTAISEKHNLSSRFTNQRIAPIVGALAPIAIDLVGNLLSGNKPPPQPTGPQQIIIQQESLPQPQIGAQESSSDNTLLIVGLIVGGIILFLIICGAFVAIIIFTGCMTQSSSTRQVNHRSSVESGYTYG